MFMTRKLGRLAVAVLVAIAFQTLMAGSPASVPLTTKTSSKSAGKSSAHAAVPKSPVTISITSWIRHGNLVVFLDGKPVFNQEFEKPVLFFSQTTTWDPPLQVPAGKHQLSAKVYGKEGKTYLSGTYDFDVSPSKGAELHVRIKGDKLTFEPES